jgi:hypothetical protein
VQYDRVSAFNPDDFVPVSKVSVCQLGFIENISQLRAMAAVGVSE